MPLEKVHIAVDSEEQRADLADISEAWLYVRYPGRSICLSPSHVPARHGLPAHRGQGYKYRSLCMQPKSRRLQHKNTAASVTDTFAHFHDKLFPYVICSMVRMIKGRATDDGGDRPRLHLREVCVNTGGWSLGWMLICGLSVGGFENSLVYDVNLSFRKPDRKREVC